MKSTIPESYPFPQAGPLLCTTGYAAGVVYGCGEGVSIEHNPFPAHRFH